MNENSDFEQDYCYKTATGIYKTGHDSIRLMKKLPYFDRSYFENINYYDLMASVLSCQNEKPNGRYYVQNKRSSI